MGIGQGVETGQDVVTGSDNGGWLDWAACLVEVIDWDEVNDLVDS